MTKALQVTIDGKPYLLTPAPQPRVRRERRFHSSGKAPQRGKHNDAGRAALASVRAPQVTYAAKFPMRDERVKAIDSLRDKQVYRLIRTAATGGATRAALLLALGAADHTGIVDGAVRRLRLRGLLTVQR